MQKITEENHRLLRRIQEVAPKYNHLEWEEEAKHRFVLIFYNYSMFTLYLFQFLCSIVCFSFHSY